MIHLKIIVIKVRFVAIILLLTKPLPNTDLGNGKPDTEIRALASARGSVARRAQRPRRKPLEGPKGPRVAKTRESEGPKGPRTSKAQSALASATICFSRFSQKSRFSRHNLSTFMTAKMHENFNRVLYLRYEHRVKKSKQFVNRVDSYARLKFRKNAAFVSKWVTKYPDPTLERGHNFAKSHPCLIDHNLSSVKDSDLI